MANCKHCHKSLPFDGNCVYCHHCKGNYHFECSIAETTYRAKGQSARRKWKCVQCRSDESDKEELDAASTESGFETVDLKNLIDDVSEMRSKLAVIADMQICMLEIRRELAAANEGRDFISQKYDEIEKSMSLLVNQNKLLEKSVAELAKFNKEKDKVIEDLGQRILKLEQEKCERNIEVHGVEYKEDENLLQLVQIIGEKLQVSIKEEDIEEASRLRRRSEDKAPIIRIKLRKHAKREEILRKKRTNIIFNKDIVRAGSAGRIRVYDQ